MKTAVIITRIEPELKAHLEKTAKKAGVTLSRYMLEAAKKASGFKEKPIV